VANPFCGKAAFGAFGTPPALARGQLLRPDSQFDNVFAHQMSAGKARYHSLVLEARRRFLDGWGGRINDTLERRQRRAAIGWDDPRIVNHLGVDDEISRRLHDLIKAWCRAERERPSRQRRTRDYANAALNSTSRRAQARSACFSL
jgi:hypothetical protein